MGIVLTWFYWSYECMVWRDTWHVTCDTIGTVSPGRGNADWRRARTVNISVTVAMLSMLVYMTMTMLIPGAELIFMCPRGPGTWHCHTSPLQPASFSSANIIGCEMGICPEFWRWFTLKEAMVTTMNHDILYISWVISKEGLLNRPDGFISYSFHDSTP